MRVQWLADDEDGTILGEAQVTIDNPDTADAAWDAVLEILMVWEDDDKGEA
jgi:hypothetical protein